MSITKKRINRIDYWPGFVDALSTLVMAIMFLLSIFAITQFMLSNEISGKDNALAQLNSQINELTQLLALEKASKQNLENQLQVLSATLAQAQSEKSALQTLLDQNNAATQNTQQQTEQLTQSLADEKKISERAAAQVNLLNQQIAALRTQIANLAQALEESEARDKQSNAKIADLGRRLNVALAQRVQELNRYRSDFFGRLREILTARDDIRIVGDRFVFQSEVLFPSGSAQINQQGLREMKQLAIALIEIAQTIPQEINWILRVDGHTDNIPLSSSSQFSDNWELSAARATSVVRYLIEQGVPASRLAAAGFGEFKPLENANTQQARNKNRRIELKLTQH